MSTSWLVGLIVGQQQLWSKEVRAIRLIRDKKIQALCVLLCVLVQGCGLEEAYQEAADSYRLQHLKYYGELLQEYNQQTGTYPFLGDSELPTYVFVANDEQDEFTRSGPPYEHRVLPLADFFDEIERSTSSLSTSTANSRLPTKWDPTTTRSRFQIPRIRDLMFSALKNS